MHCQIKLSLRGPDRRFRNAYSLYSLDGIDQLLMIREYAQKHIFEKHDQGSEYEVKLTDDVSILITGDSKIVKFTLSSDTHYIWDIWNERVLPEVISELKGIRAICIDMYQNRPRA
jgi:hypothetical protein